MRKERILIVDDQPAQRETMKEILDREGYDTVAVGSGEEALKLANQAFDLLLADIVIPNMGGLELIETFRRESPDTMPMIITGYASVETAQSAIQHGIYDYIAKPFDRAKLCTAVAKALGRKRFAEENHWLNESVELHREFESRIESQD